MARSGRDRELIHLFFTPRTFFRVIGVLAILLLAMLGRPVPHSISGSSDSKFNGLAVSSLWSNEMTLQGPEKAYTKFLSVYQNQSFTTQHLASHIFGSLLYDNRGLEGINVCQQDFAYGCYHGFFAKALGINGLEIIKDMDLACLNKYGPLGTGCQHGIGHGIMEYLGSNSLNEALDKCSLTTQINPFFGCSTGVFMEYNLQTQITSSEVKLIPRSLTTEGIYFPCQNLTNSGYRQTCYYQQPQWWNRIFNSDFTKIGLSCNGISNSSEREACFLGMGGVAAISSEYSSSQVSSRCRNIPDPSGNLLCLAGASWAFAAEPKVARLAPQICSELTGSNREMCVIKSDLIHAKSTIRE